MAAEPRRDAYRILQVVPVAHPDVIRAAYYALARIYHPDGDQAGESGQEIPKQGERDIGVDFREQAQIVAAAPIGRGSECDQPLRPDRRRCDRSPGARHRRRIALLAPARGRSLR